VVTKKFAAKSMKTVPSEAEGLSNPVPYGAAEAVPFVQWVLP
jgi:hypothetical protein